MRTPDAILLLGPTGSGKTPLGALAHERGLWGRVCRHFDFGACLRAVAAGEATVDGLSGDDVEFVRRVLDEGVLLEDEHFRIAEALLRDFLARECPGGETVLLNGLPRHVGQARDVGRWVNVCAVVELQCSPFAILARIAADTGGDRAGRDDDDAPAVRQKLGIYAERTRALLDHYAQAGARIAALDVGPETTADEMWVELNGGEAGC